MLNRHGTPHFYKLDTDPKTKHTVGTTKNHALVLEDSEAGIQAAYNGQIKVICIPDMKQPEEQYVKMTEQVLPSLNDVTPLLKKHRLKRL